MPFIDEVREAYRSSPVFEVDNYYCSLFLDYALARIKAFSQQGCRSAVITLPAEILPRIREHLEGEGFKVTDCGLGWNGITVSW